MQLKKVHIDGFGIFNDKQIDGFTSGVNLLYGPNEFGKTTFLEFIRRVLFGFPARRGNINQYPALHGGRYGGKLFCELNNGDELSIHRTEGSHGGPVTIQLGTSEYTGQEELNRLLDSISQTFYENVYAFSLNELQEIDSLSEDEIRNRIYGAGLELGGKSLTDIKKVFNDYSDVVFKPKGKTQKLPGIYNNLKTCDIEIREIQRGLIDFEKLKEEKESLESDVNEFEKEISTLTEKKYYLENMKNLYPNYIKLCQSQSELDELEDLKDFPEDALDVYDAFLAEYNTIQDRISEKNDDLELIKSQFDALTYNEEIIGKEAQVISLQRLSEKYSSSKKDFETVGIEKNVVLTTVKKEVGNIGEGWSIEKINNFNLTHKQLDTIENLKSNFQDIKTKINNTNIKLEQHLEQKSQKLSGRYLSPNYFKISQFILAVLGLIGAIIGFTISNWLIISVSLVITLIGFLLGINLTSKNSVGIIDSLEKRYNDQKDVLNKEKEQYQKEWNQLLSELGMDELSLGGYDVLIRAIERIKDSLQKIEDYDGRLQRMEKTINEVQVLHDEVITAIDDSMVSDNVETNLTIFSQVLNNARETKGEKDGLKRQMDELEIRIALFNSNLKKKEEEIQNYLSTVKTKDVEELKRKNGILTKKNVLAESIREETNTLSAAVGDEEKLKEFIDSISELTPEKIDADIELNDEKLAEIKPLKDDSVQKIGEIQNQLSNLSSNEDLLFNQSELELNKTLLNDSAREWVKSQIALNVLGKAIAKYENTRQPDVINTAKDVFSKITNSKYPTIQMQAENQNLIVKDVNGNSKNVTELSRGTLEELYFSMRLGLIEEYEKRAEPMPFVMDDTFVNFDDDRRGFAIETLNDFAVDRQVIVLTCHKGIRDLYESAEANVITID